MPGAQEAATEFDDTADSKCGTTASEYQAEVDAADQELVGLPVIPEDGEEEDVSWMKEWAVRDEGRGEQEGGAGGGGAGRGGGAAGGTETEGVTG